MCLGSYSAGAIHEKEMSGPALTVSDLCSSATSCLGFFGAHSSLDRNDTMTKDTRKSWGTLTECIFEDELFSSVIL